MEETSGQLAWFSETNGAHTPSNKACHLLRLVKAMDLVDKQESPLLLECPVALGLGYHLWAGNVVS
jgi:hypothetical protein